ncbi:MAG: hypothetical protein AAFR04_02050 [Pseudomonadota bacterium]
MARIEFATVAMMEQTAQAASPDALFQLGMVYASGRDVDVDLITAHKWFNLAALRGNEAARNYRTEIAAEMSKADIAKAQRMAREFLSKRPN